MEEQEHLDSSVWVQKAVICKREITISCKEQGHCKNSEVGSKGPKAKSRTQSYQGQGSITRTTAHRKEVASSQQ